MLYNKRKTYKCNAGYCLNEKGEWLRTVSNKFYKLSYKKISLNIFKKYPNCFNISMVLNYIDVPEDMLREYLYENDSIADDIIHHQLISMDMLENEVMPISLKKWGAENVFLWISAYQNLDMKFLHTYRNYLDWDTISQYQIMTEEFMDAHEKYIKWKKISNIPNLSMEFIDKHADQVNWDHISLYQKLSKEFIYNHAYQLNSTYLYKNKKLDEEAKHIVAST